MKTEEEAVQELKLSCKEAGLILRVMDLNKDFTKGCKPEEIEAAKHYANCELCMRLGLPEILGKQINCREALEICAKRPGPIHLYPARTFYPRADTIWEEVAYEHVNGRWVLFEDNLKVRGYNTHFDCCKGPCHDLLSYWLSVPLCSSYDGDREKADQIPFMIGLFVGRGWPIDNLIKIQHNHVQQILKDVTKKSIDMTYLVEYEILANLRVLQSLVCPDKQK